MLISEQPGDHLGVPSKEVNNPLAQTTKQESNALAEPKLTPRQQQKRDAFDLADLIYDIYKESMSSASIGAISGKGANHA